MAAVSVIGNGVVTEVVDHLLQHLGHTPDRHRSALQVHGDVLFLRHGAQLLPDAAGQSTYRSTGLRSSSTFSSSRRESLMMSRHQVDEALGLPADVAGKVADVLRLHHAVFQDLRRAQDGGQRRLELMGDVGGELPPQALPLLPLRGVPESSAPRRQAAPFSSTGLARTWHAAVALLHASSRSAGPPGPRPPLRWNSPLRSRA